MVPSSRAACAAMLCFLGGCSLAGGRTASVVAKGEYQNPDLHFSFQVPHGWVEAKSRNPFRKPEHVARFDSPQGDAAVVAHGVTLGEESCVEAAREALLAKSRAKLRAVSPFTIETEDGELPAWRAAIDYKGGQRSGEAALFCEGGHAVVLETSGAKSAPESRKKELAAALDSFAHRKGRKVVLVRAVEKPKAIAYFTHQVTWRGQTLGEIARWYTGGYENWKKLADLNGLTVPEAPLKVGREIKIPPELVTREAPMRKPRAAAPSKAPVAAEKMQAVGDQAPSSSSEAPAPAEAEGVGEPSEEAAPELPAVIGPR